MSYPELVGIAADLEVEFNTRQFKWTATDGAEAVPNRETLTAMLDRMTRRLYDETDEPATQIEVGRLFVKKDDVTPSKADVYLWIGEVNV